MANEYEQFKNNMREIANIIRRLINSNDRGLRIDKIIELIPPNGFSEINEANLELLETFLNLDKFAISEVGSSLIQYQSQYFIYFPPKITKIKSDFLGTLTQDNSDIYLYVCFIFSGRPPQSFDFPYWGSDSKKGKSSISYYYAVPNDKRWSEEYEGYERFIFYEKDENNNIKLTHNLDESIYKNAYMINNLKSKLEDIDIYQDVNYSSELTGTLKAELEKLYEKIIGSAPPIGCSYLQASTDILNKLKEIPNIDQEYFNKTATSLNFKDYDDNARNYALSGFTDLTDVTIQPKSGTTTVGFGKGIFVGCSKLETVILPANTNRIRGAFFRGCSNLKTVKYINSSGTITGEDNYITLPPKITNIVGNAFNGCKNITNVILPNTVTYMSEEVFKNCSSLKSIQLGNGLESIDTHCFYGCFELEKIDFPETFTHFADKILSNSSSSQGEVFAHSPCNITFKNKTKKPTLPNPRIFNHWEGKYIYYPKDWDTDLTTWTNFPADCFNTPNLDGEYYRLERNGEIEK